MTDDKIIERIKKLLALASNNPEAEEAALAAAKAQAMIDEHSIDIALLSASEAPEEAKLQEVEERVVYQFKGRRLTHWILDITHAVCQSNDLYSWSGWGTRSRRAMKAAGPLTQLIAAEILVDWLVREVEHLYTQDKKNQDDVGSLWEPGKAYANSFKMGCTHQISMRLRHAAHEAREDAERRASMTREEAYTLALKEEDTETLVSLDAGEKRYDLAIVQKAFILLEEQKKENKDWAKKKYKFTSRGYSGSTSSYAGWDGGVKAGKKAKIKTPKRLGDE